MFMSVQESQNNSNPPVEKSLYRHIPPAERLGLSLEQAAEYVGMSTDSLRPHVDAGEIAVRWKGRYRVLDRQSLEAWWKRGLEGGDGK
jgi:excisionase family DNA binding protein